LFLLVGAHEFDVLDEHAVVDKSWHLVRRDQAAVDLMRVVVGGEVVPVVVVVDWQVPVAVFEQFQPSFVVNVGSILKHGPCLEGALHVAIVLPSVEEAAESVRTIGGLRPFLVQDLFNHLVAGMMQ